MTGEAEDRFARLLRDLKGRPLRKRFYEAVAVAGEAPPFALTLDGRQVKTPMKQALVVPSRPLAEAVGEEWRSQVEVIDPALMPLTRLANTTLDRVVGEEPRLIAEIIRYAASDLLCYRAEGPEALCRREALHWDPVLTWAATTLGHPFLAVSGVKHEAQPEATLVAVEAHLTRRDAFALTALHNLTTLTGSALLAMAVETGALAADAAWTAAHVDEDWQIEQWGEDIEAARRRQARRGEFDSTLRFLLLARS
jgi:chaperone required for assembly of F1-ATPase